MKIIDSLRKLNINLVKTMNKTLSDSHIQKYDLLIEKEVLSILGFNPDFYVLNMVNYRLLDIKYDSSHKVSIMFLDKKATVSFLWDEQTEVDFCFFEKNKELTEKANSVHNLFSDIPTLDSNIFLSMYDNEYNLNKMKKLNYENKKTFSCFNNDGNPSILNFNYLYSMAAIRLNKGVSLNSDDYIFLEKNTPSLVSAFEIKKMKDNNPLFELLHFNNDNKLTEESKDLIELNYGY